MRVKMLIAMALSSLFAVSLAYAAPVVQKADDTSADSSNNAMQTPTDNSMSGSPSQNNNMTAPGDANVGQTPPLDPNSAATNNGNSNDDMSADTATGDDDY